MAFLFGLPLEPSIYVENSLFTILSTKQPAVDDKRKYAEGLVDIFIQYLTVTKITSLMYFNVDKIFSGFSIITQKCKDLNGLLQSKY